LNRKLLSVCLSPVTLNVFPSDGCTVWEEITRRTPEKWALTLTVSRLFSSVKPTMHNLSFLSLKTPQYRFPTLH
jgi:hypothetical protein